MARGFLRATTTSSRSTAIRRRSARTRKPSSHPNTAIPPGRAETPDSAFRKLDAANKGYVSKDDAKQLSGFDAAFQQADANNDGKLTQDEFKKAWSTYSGNSK